MRQLGWRDEFVEFPHNINIVTIVDRCTVKIKSEHILKSLISLTSSLIERR